MKTAATGHGVVTTDFANAKEIMAEGERDLPELKHWFIPIL